MPGDYAQPAPGEGVHVSRDAPGGEPLHAGPSSGVADGIPHPHDPRIIPLERVTGGLVAAFVATASFVGVLSVALAAVLEGRLPWLGLAVLLAAWAMVNGAFTWHMYRWPAVAYRHASYRVDAEGIEIRHGVFWRQTVNVPRSRVQHTDVSQGPLERRFGLATLVIYTAGTDHARVALSGLAHDVAFRIREHLLPGETSDAV